MLAPAHLLTLFVGSTARGPASPVRISGLIEFRRRFGEGVHDASGPPGDLLRGVWAYFRCGGQRAIIASTGEEPLPAELGPGELQLIAECIERGLHGEVPALVVLPGLGADKPSLLALGRLGVMWPDPSPLVLLDASRPLSRAPTALVELSRELLESGGGRFRIVSPPALGAAPFEGPSRSGSLSPGAMAAGLVASRGSARVAGSSLSLPPPYTDSQVLRLLDAGVMVLLPAGHGQIKGMGLPRLPVGGGSSSCMAVESSPFAPLLSYLEEALAHHAHASRDPGLYRRVERDARSALSRFWGRTTQGFLVRCDEELNPPDVRERGELVVEVVLGPRLPLVRQVVLELTLR